KWNYKKFDDMAYEITQGKYKDSKIIIEGYTDITGDVETNIKISKKRAEAVLNYFQENYDISRKRFKLDYFTSERPLIRKGSKAARERERRVEIKAEVETQKAYLRNTIPETLGKMYFDTGSWSIYKYFDFLEDIAHEITEGEYKDRTILIQGHADKRGSFVLNLKVSRARAQNVLNHLHKKYDIPLKRFKMDYFSSLRPVVEGETAKELKKNRRTEIIALNELTSEVPIAKVDRIELEINKKKIKANGKDKITFQTKAIDEYGNEADVDVDIFVNDNKIKGDTFTSNEPGKHEVYAKYKNIKSEILEIEVIREKIVLPTIEIIGETIYRVREMVEIDIKIHNVNEKPATVEIEGLPEKARFDDDRLKILWLPNDSDEGDHEMTVIAKVGNQEAKEKFTITILPRDRSPIIKKIGEIKINEGDKLELKIEAYDPDGDEIKLELENNPKEMTLEESVIKWTPDYGQAGEYEVILIAKANDKETKQKINIEVLKTKRVIKEINFNWGKKEVYAEYTKVKFKSTITYDNKDKKVIKDFEVYIDGKKIKGKEYIPKKMGDYEVFVKKDKIESAKKILKVRPSYERKKKTVSIEVGYRFSPDSFIELGVTEKGSLISIYPGRGDVYGLEFDYDWNSYLQFEVQGEQINTVPNYKMDDLDMNFISRGISLNLKAIPLRFNNSRIKLGVGVYQSIQNRITKNIEFQETNIDEELNYNEKIGYNLIGEYEMFFLEDKLSLEIGSQYRSISTKFKDGKLNDKEVKINDLKSDYQILNMTGVKYYLKMGYHY
ncbi:MAG: OmpA family protein, partial [Fusobacteriota bacterium]